MSLPSSQSNRSSIGDPIALPLASTRCDSVWAVVAPAGQPGSRPHVTSKKPTPLKSSSSSSLPTNRQPVASRLPAARSAATTSFLIRLVSPLPVDRARTLKTGAQLTRHVVGAEAAVRALDHDQQRIQRDDSPFFDRAHDRRWHLVRPESRRIPAVAHRLDEQARLPWLDLEPGDPGEVATHEPLDVGRLAAHRIVAAVGHRIPAQLDRLDVGLATRLDAVAALI